jgi:hypothetical protein
LSTRWQHFATNASDFNFVIDKSIPLKNKYFYIIIFGFSTLWALSLFVLQRLLGLDETFHPDALYYLNPQTFSSEMLLKPNDGYVVFIKFFASYDALVAIAVNILAFALANCLIASLAQFRTYKEFLVLLLLSPYRVHLAVHPLKDSLIILFALLGNAAILRAAYCRPNTWKALYIIFLSLSLFSGTLLRSVFIIYLVPLLVFNWFRLQEFKLTSKKLFIFLRSWVLLLSLTFVLLIVLRSPDNLTFLQDRSELGDMGGRFGVGAYDFASFGFPLAPILKSVFWPLMALFPTSLLFLSLSSALISIDYGVHMARSLKMPTRINKFSLFLAFYVIAFIIGMLVSAYTAYARYVLPLSMSLYIIIAFYKTERSSFNQKKVHLGLSGFDKRL